jgi:hypothetical protein
MLAAPRPQPTLFSLPGLRQQPLWPRDAFPKLRRFEEEWLAVRAEYDELVSGGAKSDYAPGAHSLHEGDWRWYSYVARGKKQPWFQQRCPRTAALLDSLGDDLMCHTPIDFAFFSHMKPGTVIKPHFAMHNLRIRVHLPLHGAPPPRAAERPTTLTCCAARQFRAGAGSGSPSTSPPGKRASASRSTIRTSTRRGTADRGTGLCSFSTCGTLTLPAMREQRWQKCSNRPASKVGSSEAGECTLALRTTHLAPGSDGSSPIAVAIALRITTPNGQAVARVQRLDGVDASRGLAMTGTECSGGCHSGREEALYHVASGCDGAVHRG